MFSFIVNDVGPRFTLGGFSLLIGLPALLLQQKHLQVAVHLLFITLGWASTENRGLLSLNSMLLSSCLFKVSYGTSWGAVLTEMVGRSTLSTEKHKGSVQRQEKRNKSSLTWVRTGCRFICKGLCEWAQTSLKNKQTKMPFGVRNTFKNAGMIPFMSNVVVA